MPLSSLLKPLALSVLLLTANLVHAAPLRPEVAADEDGARSASISPDGKYIASISVAGKASGLILTDTETLKGKMIRATKYGVASNIPYLKGSPQTVAWITNTMLAVEFEYGVESVDLEGKRITAFDAALIGKAEPANWESTQILLSVKTRDRWEAAIGDGLTGKRRRFDYPDAGGIQTQVFDAQGELRAVTLSNSALWRDETTVTNWYKPRQGGSWQALETFRITDNYWLPYFVPAEDDQLIVRSSAGRDTKAIFRYDTKRKQMGELMAGHPTQDIIGVRGLDESEFKSVVTNGMRAERYWFDEKWDALQKAVDQALPGRINYLSGDNGKRVLIYSYGDVDPGHWYVLDVATMKLRDVAARLTDVDVKAMRPMEIHSYAARDGLKIPAYLTLPEQHAQPMPTIVMIHGGPAVRDAWEWDPEVQLLATHGYAVFQPQFRGSYGFGDRFEAKGYGQWGLSMQDDITDGVEYLIRKGIADPKRICIYGSYYGGYAALWGLAKTPNLYRCGVSFAGVSDVAYMLDDWSDRNYSKVMRELQRTTVGTLEEHQAKFDAVSPLKHADQIQAPVLIVHGERDARIPFVHSTRMRTALERNNKVVEWKSFHNEGHGLYYEYNRFDFYRTLLNFFDKHIGNTQPKANEPAAPSAETTASK